MKSIKLTAAAFIAAAMFFNACENASKPAAAAAESAATSANAAADAAKKAAETAHMAMDSAGMKMNSMTAKYYCPMDKDITSDKPGKCSKCGMDLVEVGKDSKGMEKMHDMKKMDEMKDMKMKEDKKMEKH